VTGNDDGDQFGWFAEAFQTVQDTVDSVVRGKGEVVHLALVCMLAEGHLLVEDVPGVGKTTLARALAVATGSEWQRIQFTPDLLPSDVTGVQVYNQATGEFVFKQGPVFAGVVLADEINRASPKTQSALLEVMEERTVTVDRTTYPVPRPFMVVATQNPVDMDGTYALPEAQLDRFMLRVSVGYPTREAALEILDGRAATGRLLEQLEPAVGADIVRALVAAAHDVYAAPSIKDYMVRLTEATREREDVRLGASPRASLALLRAARVEAASHGRNYVLPEDVARLAVPVLAHRLTLTGNAELRGLDGRGVVEEVVRGEAVPQVAART
jgi:MoxR-like ATPase